MNVERSQIVNLSGTNLTYPSADGDVQVLSDVNLEVHLGEIIAVTGPSGSGKSSLISIIGGLEEATSGRNEVLGIDLKNTNETIRTNLRRHEIGVIFQSFHLIPAMTALQNAALPLMLSGIDHPEKVAIDMLERVGLAHRLHHLPSALSGGEQQRVAIARAFAAKPKLILADEPTGNLDQTTGYAVEKMMFELVRETNAAMIMVTHDPDLAKKCDRLIKLDAGKIIS